MKHILILSFFYCFMITASAAPNSMWYLDELGTAGYAYTIDDAIAGNDGTAYITPSTGNGSGKICSALDFSAHSTADYAKLDEAALNGATNFTISVWHKGNSNAGRSLLSGARIGQDNALLMWFSSGNRFYSYIDGSAASAITFPSITDNQWHHLVWRRSGNQSCFFTDGIQRGCKTVSVNALQIESLILAQEQDNVGGAFDINQDWEGLLDELLIYRSALSNADILNLYNNQNSGNDWNGVAHACQTTPPDPPPADYGYSDWHFDEDSWNGTANEVVDSHGGQHGTAHNAPTVPGKICNAIDLRASSTTDYATLGAGSLDGVGDFTISVWHKSSSANSKSLLSGAVNGSINELIFWHPSATQFNGFLNSHSLGAVATSNIANNTWRHLVWRRTGSQTCYFIDSQLQGCQSGADSVPLNITSLILGQEQDSLGGGFSSAQDWEGIVDELLIFRRALNNSAISSIYNNQNAGNNWDGSHRACPNMPSMKLTKNSVVISDPINTTINPKRIPGAIVRYTLHAQNAHTTAGENVTMNDNLNNMISSGKIDWIGNIIINSPNTNGGAATSLTDAIDADVGQFSGNILTVECGNINNLAPCIVRYDVKVK